MSNDKEPEPPSDLGEDGKKLWIEFTTRYRFQGFDDILLLQTLCRNEDQIHRFRSVIEKEGFTITSKSGMVRAHPLLSQLRGLETDQRRILKQLLPQQPPPYRDRKPGRPSGFSPGERQPRLAS
jgi:phage terminase small subunit